MKSSNDNGAKIQANPHPATSAQKSANQYPAAKDGSSREASVAQTTVGAKKTAYEKASEGRDDEDQVKTQEDAPDPRQEQAP